MLSIQTNVTSLVAQENLRVNSDFQAQTITRLTSGYRINSAGDDAAGLVVANQFRSNVAELNQGVRNANDGLSALQIIDGGLSNISTILDRMKTLATESASDTFQGDRTTLQNEFKQLASEIDRQSQNIGLSGIAADAGTAAAQWLKNLSVYIGGGPTATVGVDLSAGKVDAKSLGVDAATIDISTTGGAGTGITAINAAISTLGTVQGSVGAGENRMGYAISLAQSQVSSFSAAESRIRDADMAAEAANLTKAQVLQQASIAALAQANSAPQAVLTLLRG